jgi:TPR repeat protein
MKEILYSIVAFAIINGCTNATPKVVETKKQIEEPIVELKEESKFDIAKKSCLDGNEQGCIDFGYILMYEDYYELAKTAFSEAFRLGDKDGGMRGSYFVECLEKNTKSCHMLGYYSEEGKGGKQYYELARIAYQQSIDLGSTESLGSLAHLYSQGLGGEKDLFKATKFFVASCNAGKKDINYENCYNAGNKYYFGKGVKQDYFKAFEYYKKSCNSVYANGCDAVGFAYYNGEGVKQSESMAKKYFGKACDGKVEEGCNRHSSPL